MPLWSGVAQMPTTRLCEPVLYRGTPHACVWQCCTEASHMPLCSGVVQRHTTCLCEPDKVIRYDTCWETKSEWTEIKVLGNTVRVTGKGRVKNVFVHKSYCILECKSSWPRECTSYSVIHSAQHPGTVTTNTSGLSSSMQLFILSTHVNYL